MSARPLHVTLAGAVLILSAIAPVPTFAEKTAWDVQELYKHKGVRGSLDEIFFLEFVAAVARQVFRNGLALKDIKNSPDFNDRRPGHANVEKLGTGTRKSYQSSNPRLKYAGDALVDEFTIADTPATREDPMAAFKARWLS